MYLKLSIRDQLVKMLSSEQTLTKKRLPVSPHASKRAYYHMISARYWTRREEVKQAYAWDARHQANLFLSNNGSYKSALLLKWSEDAALAWEFWDKRLVVWGIYHSLSLRLKAGSLKVFVTFKTSDIKFDREEAVVDKNFKLRAGLIWMKYLNTT